MQKDRNCEICERMYLKIVSSGFNIHVYGNIITLWLNYLMYLMFLLRNGFPMALNLQNAILDTF